jgi:probable phosphoglycerate mutase
MVRLVIVRHGQTEWNRQERLRGRADVPLNETGLRQAHAAAQRIAGAWPVQAIYYSDLARTRATAQAIADVCHAPASPQHGLLDIDYGAWTGLTLAEVGARSSALLALWQSEPHRVDIPSGESLALVRERSFACMETLAAQHDGQTIVLVSHLVVCRLLVLAALGLDNSHFLRIQQETATINVFERQNGVYTVVTINDACHMRGV